MYTRDMGISKEAVVANVMAEVMYRRGCYTCTLAQTCVALAESRETAEREYDRQKAIHQEQNETFGGVVTNWPRETIFGKPKEEVIANMERLNDGQIFQIEDAAKNAIGKQCYPEIWSASKDAYDAAIAAINPKE